MRMSAASSQILLGNVQVHDAIPLCNEGKSAQSACMVPDPETKQPQSFHSEAAEILKPTGDLAAATEEETDQTETKQHYAGWLWNWAGSRELQIG